MFNFRFIVLFVLLMTSFGFAQQGYSGMMNMLPYLDDFNVSNKPEPEIIEAFFIEQVFVKPLLDSREQIKLLYNDDEEEQFLNTSASDQFFNSIYSREIAKMIAKQNVLGLKKQVARMNAEDSKTNFGSGFKDSPENALKNSRNQMQVPRKKRRSR